MNGWNWDQVAGEEAGGHGHEDGDDMPAWQHLTGVRVDDYRSCTKWCSRHRHGGNFSSGRLFRTEAFLRTPRNTKVQYSTDRFFPRFFDIQPNFTEQKMPWLYCTSAFFWKTELLKRLLSFCALAFYLSLSLTYCLSFFLFSSFPPYLLSYYFRSSFFFRWIEKWSKLPTTTTFHFLLFLDMMLLSIVFSLSFSLSLSFSFNF